jgi:hypothetical protein
MARERINFVKYIRSYLLGENVVRSHFDAREYPDAKAWVIKAVESEDRRPSDPLWKKTPSADDMPAERPGRIRRHGVVKTQELYQILEACESGRR